MDESSGCTILDAEKEFEPSWCVYHRTTDASWALLQQLTCRPRVVAGLMFEVDVKSANFPRDSHGVALSNLRSVRPVRGIE